MNYNKLLRRKRKALSEGNNTLLATACVDLAEEYFRDEDYKLAINEFIEAANIFMQKSKFLEYATANRMVGEAYTNLKQYDKALKYQNIYLNIAKEQNNKIEEQRALATIGHTYLTRFLDNLDSNKDESLLQLAYKSFMKSMVICESLTGIPNREHMDMKARLLANLGVIQEHLGKFEKSIELLDKSIGICKQYDLYEQLERGYTVCASLYTNNKEYSKAIQNLNLAIETAAKLDKRTSLMTTALLSKANILIKMSDFHAAKVVLLKAYKLKNQNDLERATVEKILKIVVAICYTEDALITTGADDYKTRKRLYEKLGDGASALEIFPEAIEYYKKMLECAIQGNESGKELSPCYVSLAETYRDDKQFDLAIKYFEEDLNVWKNNAKEEVQTLLNLADTMEAAGRNYNDICNVYDRAKRLVLDCNELTRLKHRVHSRYAGMVKRFGKHCSNLIADDNYSHGSEATTTDDSEEEENCTPNIGDDICLDEITDVSDESETDTNKPRSARKRVRGLQIKRNQKGETQLHVACIKGNQPLVRQLLDQGHAVNVRDYCGWLPIHEACISGHEPIVALLLDKGALINDRGGVHCGGVTPLHDAAVNGHLEIVDLLLRRGANCFVKNDVGETPYHTLINWRNSTKDTLTDREDELYETLKERLKSSLLKVGHAIDADFVHKENMALITDSDHTHAVPDCDKNDDDDELEQSMNINSKIGSLRRAVDKQLENENDLLTTDGSNEYKKVIGNLRHRHPDNLMKKRKSEEIEQSFWNDNDDSDDGNWLINDLATTCTSKKPKVTTATSISPKKKSSSRPSSSSSLGSTSNDFNSRPKRRLHQASLTEIGVTRAKGLAQSRSSSQQRHMRGDGTTDTIIEATAAPVISSLVDRDEMVRNHANGSSSTHPPTMMINEPILAIDVKIDEKFYRVPIPLSETHVRTIQWLGEEASKRYSRKECMKPELELETSNGAILADDDYVSILFPAGTVQSEKVYAKIVKWNLPALHERYKEACNSLSTDVVDDIVKTLQETTVSLDLHDRGLRSKRMAPVCKAILRQTNLTCLNLSGNLIENDCVELLISHLFTLKHLTELNLGLNHITTDSVTRLADAFASAAQKPLCEHLTKLILSHNPLGNEALRPLAILTGHLKLKVLQLSDVGFDGNAFADCNSGGIAGDSTTFRLDHLQELDLSNNELNADGIGRILARINPAMIEHVDISNNSCKDIVRPLIDSFLREDSPHAIHLSLRILNLSCNFVTDKQVFDLIRVLNSCNAFQCLNLSGNSDLTSLTLRRLLQYKPLKLLDLYDCENIFKYFENNLQDLKRIETLRISVNHFDSEIELLINAYRENFGDEFICKRELEGLLELICM